MAKSTQHTFWVMPLNFLAVYQVFSGNPLPPGGPGLAIATVEEFLGVPIQYYAQIDFSGVCRFH